MKKVYVEEGVVHSTFSGKGVRLRWGEPGPFLLAQM